jgi:hydrocephalus-inducing protein
LLGDEFVFNQTTGVIDALSSFPLVLHFRALRPLNLTGRDRKLVKLLVSSVNSFLGFMENHSITITAEAYDVALEISLPKGNDGGLDFGNIRVNLETKLSLTLRNKGKYPIKYNFLTESTDDAQKEVLKYLNIIPSSGELPVERNAQNQIVQIVLNPRSELFLKDSTILKCQITEPPAPVPLVSGSGSVAATNTNDKTSVGPVAPISTIEPGTVIANIPIRVSVRAVFTKFNITPLSEIHFGALQVNSKRQEKIIIENRGEFDFKYTITKYVAKQAETQPVNQK